MSKQQFPPQTQDHRPGTQDEMTPKPQTVPPWYKPAGKLVGRRALITGGDSGIGRSVAVLFAMEGADVAIVYKNEHGDAEDTRKMVTENGRKCVVIAGDIGEEAFCQEAVNTAVQELGGLDIVVNNAAEQHPQKSIEEITAEQLERTFRTNIFSFFYIVKAALPHLQARASIINTTSITAYKGSPELLDYSSTKGAIVAFTRSLSQALADKKIRVNAVAPGPIWTPLIPSTFPEEKVANFGGDTPLERAGQPGEVAAGFVFLAGEDSSYMSGQVLHINGGEIVNG
jgi:NAD(P)-dependent dehydrogenase (short-subunit alcohol dehydrogenase family)